MCCQNGRSPDVENSGENLEEQSSTTSAFQEHSPEHMDHNPKHGGIFFMALDYSHHLEGTLTPGGLFQLYLYDALTQPLDPETVKAARGTVHWGEFPDPPGIPLKIGEDERTLVAGLGQEISFPVTLTLLLYLPGSDPNGDPELFNFIFDEYSTLSTLQEPGDGEE
jgi:hypothetical protein